jgi:hypothetical protein
MIKWDGESNDKAGTRTNVSRLLVAIIVAFVVTPAAAQQLTSTERDRIDSGVLTILAATGAPSASVAIVRRGEIVYERAYGDARIDPKTAAAPSMRYAIGSVSKQFTATALLLLEDFYAPRDDIGDRFRHRPPDRQGCRSVPAERTRPPSARSEGSSRMVVRRRTTRDDGPRPRALGHRDHHPDDTHLA